MRSFTVKENHIGSVVSKINRYRQSFTGFLDYFHLFFITFFPFPSKIEKLQLTQQDLGNSLKRYIIIRRMAIEYKFNSEVGIL